MWLISAERVLGEPRVLCSGFFIFVVSDSGWHVWRELSPSGHRNGPIRVVAALDARLLRVRFGSQSRDKPASLPQFNGTAVYGLLGRLDGLLIAGFILGAMLGALVGVMAPSCALEDHILKVRRRSGALALFGRCKASPTLPSASVTIDQRGIAISLARSPARIDSSTMTRSRLR